MSDISSATPSATPCESALRRVTGFWLVGVLALAVFVMGVMLITSAVSLPDGLPAAGSLDAKPDTAARFVATNLPLPGFERRGNTLVGEVTTRDGTALRLVFDVRTNTLIGLRRLETAQR